MPQLPSPFSFTFVNGAELGLGVDLLTGQLRQYAVPNVTTAANTLNEVVSHTQMVSTESDYETLLNTVANVQGSTLTASFSAGVSYLKQTSMSATTFSLVIGATVQATENAVTNFSDLKLTDDAKAFLSDNGPAAFMATYGTHFIGGFIDGGSFLGTVNVRTSSTTTQQSIAATMSAALSDGFAGGSFDASFKTAYNQYASESSLDATQSSDGGPVSVAADPDAMVTQVKTFVTNLTNGTDKGRHLIMLGYTWDMVGDVRTILAEKYPTASMQIPVSPEVQSILATELNALSYLEQTAATLLQQGNFVIPRQADLLSQALENISLAQSAISSLTIAQVSALDVTGAEQYVQSSAIGAIINPIAARKVAVNWTGALDGAFVSVPNPFSGTAYLSVSGDNQSLGTFTHSRPEGDDPPQQATLSFALTSSNGMLTLQSRFDWNDPYGPGSGTWWGEAVDVTNDAASTTPSVAAWPAWNWNLVKAQLA